MELRTHPSEVRGASSGCPGLDLVLSFSREPSSECRGSRGSVLALPTALSASVVSSERGLSVVHPCPQQTLVQEPCRALCRCRRAWGWQLRCFCHLLWEALHSVPGTLWDKQVPGGLSPEHPRRGVAQRAAAVGLRRGGINGPGLAADASVLTLPPRVGPQQGS